MDREKHLKEKQSIELFKQLHLLNGELNDAFKGVYNRSIPFNENVFDRWERAKMLGFGSGTSIYDSSFVFGDVKVGQNCWIGPNTILDGSGGLTIGNDCTVSAGVHIYSHDNVKATLTGGKLPVEKRQVKIGNNVYIAPNVIISRGVEIADFCVIGAASFLNISIPSYTIAAGQPARIIGKIEIDGSNVNFDYNI